MNPVELRYHRTNTTAFIAVKPSVITLTPRDRVRQPSGGFKYVDKAVRAAQVFRIIELGANQTPPIIQLTDGTQREAEFWLLGQWDALVDIDDYWTAVDPGTGNERTWIVGDIVRPNGYETRALVVERGQ